MLHYFIVALYQCCNCLFFTVNIALFECTIYYLQSHSLMLHYINIALFHVVLLMWDYFDVARFGVALFAVALLNVVLF